MSSLTHTQFTVTKVQSSKSYQKQQRSTISKVIKNGYTIDTDKRKKALADKMKANAQAAEAAKAKAKALVEKNKLLQVKAVEQKKKLALEAKMKAEKAKALALKVNKTVGGSSKFKNSFTPAPAKADPFKGKEYKGGFSLFGLFGKKEKK